MTNSKHQWTTFQKGRMKIQACGCCGQMKLPSNTQSVCDNKNILSSPIVMAGYQIATYLPVATRLVA